MPRPKGPFKANPRNSQRTTPPASSERLNKLLAAAGFGSRRQCDELIASGRVEVDRQVVAELGAKVDPARHEVRVDGSPLQLGRRLYFAVNKPPGVVSTNRDPSGRPRVIDLVPAGDARVYTIGRLDQSSEGLILVTNDGELAQRLAHPRYGVEKTYHVVVAGKPEPEVLAQLRRGIHLAEGSVRARHIKVRSERPHSTQLEIVLAEGRNREIRRMLAKSGHKVLRLRRVAIGSLRLGELPLGQSRRLNSAEIEELRGWRPRRRAAPARARKRQGKSAQRAPKPRDGKSAPRVGRIIGGDPT